VHGVEIDLSMATIGAYLLQPAYFVVKFIWV
jgi:hypothetical protein